MHDFRGDLGPMMQRGPLEACGLDPQIYKSCNPPQSNSTKITQTMTLSPTQTAHVFWNQERELLTRMLDENVSQASYRQTLKGKDT